MKFKNENTKGGLTFDESIRNFFNKEKKSRGYKGEKVKGFINYYKPFFHTDREPGHWETYDFLDNHVFRVMYESVGLEVYRRLILDEDKDWVRYMVETYFSSPNTIEYLESKMMMRGV